MKKMIKQFCIFSMVGAGSFLVDYALLFIFTETVHMHYLLSSMLSFSAATAFNYIYSTKYVFECAGEQKRKGEFSIFLLLSGCGLLMNSLIMKWFVEHLELHYMADRKSTRLNSSHWS